jgi:hypothetical protein
VNLQKPCRIEQAFERLQRLVHQMRLAPGVDVDVVVWGLNAVDVLEGKKKILAPQCCQAG